MKVTVTYVDNNYEFRKKSNQMLSVCPEYNDLMVKRAYTIDRNGTVTYDNNTGKEKFDRVQLGGLGAVTGQFPVSAVNELGMDFRTAIPYHGECLNGTIKLLRLPKEAKKELAEKGKYNLPNLLKPEWIREVPFDYTPQKFEYFVLLPEGMTKDKDGIAKHRYILLHDTGIKGNITSLKEAYMELQKVPYRAFSQVGAVDGDKLIFHTPQVAAMKQAYGGNGTYKPGQVIGQFYDAYYADFDRAVVDSGRKFEERLGFNPANIWLHDRPAFAYLFEMTKRSSEGDRFEDGKRVHGTLHNPGPDYQGWMGEIESFMRVAFVEDDFIKLKNHPQYYTLKRILNKPKEDMSISDRKIIEAFFTPYFQNMLDDMGHANQTMIPIASAKINPNNASVGTVSENYGYEMVSLKDIAKGVTGKLFAIKDRIINITNGSLPAALNFHNTVGTFGNKDNDFSKLHKAEFTPFQPIFKVMKNGDKIIQNFDTPAKVINPAGYKKILDNQEKFNKLLSNTETELEKLNNEKGKFVDNEAKLKKFNAKINNINEKITKYKTKIQELSDMKLTFDFSIKDTRKKNKLWLLDLVGKQYVEGDKEKTKANLEKLFYSEVQRKSIDEGGKGFEVHGYIIPSKDKNGKIDGKDKIYANWGRSDNQKGFATFVQGYYKFLQMKEPPKALKDKGITQEKFEDMKKHTKLIFGSADKWPKDAKEIKLIKQYIDKIHKLENGKYDGSVCYVEGFFPNRLIACCDYGSFTSRFEPCGLTPLEAYAAGTPVASINTGGAPNFVFDLGKVEKNKATGFLTKNPFMIDDDKMDKKYFDAQKVKEEIMAGEEVWDEDSMGKEYADRLDDARREAASDEVAELFVRTSSIDENTYETLSKNSFNQRIGWAENVYYNREGKSADERLLEDALGVKCFIKKGENRDFIRERSLNSMEKLTGDFPEYVDFDAIRKKYPDNNGDKLDNSSSISFRGLSAISGIKNFLNNNKILNNISKSFVG